MSNKKLIDALGCFWNAAIGHCHTTNDTTAMNVVTSVTVGIDAVRNRLEELDEVEVNEHDLMIESLVNLSKKFQRRREMAKEAEDRSLSEKTRKAFSMKASAFAESKAEIDHLIEQFSK